MRNFGNVFAGYAAKEMGLPVEKFLVASNVNDILARFLKSSEMKKAGVTASLSPSMDIEISSNFERLLFEVCGRSGDKVKELMADFANKGSYKLDEQAFAKVRSNFVGASCNDEQTKATIKKVYQETGMLIDPHTAVGVYCAQQNKAEFNGTPNLVLSTAHPAKFPDAVEAATGIRPQLPARLADLFSRKERFNSLPNDLKTVQQFIVERARISN